MQIDNFELLVKDFIRTLPKPEKVPHPLMLGLVGSFASGKTFLAKHLAEDLHLVVLDMTEIRSYFVPRPEYLNEGKKALVDFIVAATKALVTDGYGVISDINLATRAYRDSFRSASHKKAFCYFVHLAASQEVAFKRVEERNVQILNGALKGEIIGKEYFDLEQSSIDDLRDVEFTFKSENMDGYLGLKSEIAARLALDLQKLPQI